MLPEMILESILSKSLKEVSSVVTDLYKNDFEEVFNKTIIDFEKKYYGFSGTNLKEFFNSPEFQSQLSLHHNYSELDYDFLGNELKAYVNLLPEISSKDLLLKFFIKLENNINKNPKLKDQLMLEYQRSNYKKITKMVEILERCLPKEVQDPGRGQQCLRKIILNKNELEEDVKILLDSSSSYERGLGKWQKNDLDGAESEFGAAISKHLPSLSKSYFQRGNVRYLQEKYADAYEDYSEASRLDPQYTDAWSNKGVALGRLGKQDDALKCFDKAIETPMSPRTRAHT